MPEKNKYSLWLMPAEYLYNQLHSLIQQLRKPYNTPAFEPHVTLLGGITGDLETIILKSAKLSSMLRYYTVTLDKVDHRQEFYRCLFVHVKHTDTVMQANAHAREVFQDSSSEAYEPHISLMYGDIQTDIKKKIIQTIGTTLHGAFIADQIHLFTTNGPPEKWSRLAQFALQR